MSQRNIRRVRIRLAASFLAVWAAVTVILFWVDKPESLFGLSSRGGYLDGSGDFSWELVRHSYKSNQMLLESLESIAPSYRQTRLG